MNNLAAPCTLVEVDAGSNMRAWKPLYNFDTTDAGRLEPLPVFFFELKIESSRGKKNQRPYRLYVDGNPCLGAQWQYDVEGAVWAAEWYVSSYAYERRSRIYAHHRTRHYAALRSNQKEAFADVPEAAWRALEDLP